MCVGYYHYSIPLTVCHMMLLILDVNYYRNSNCTHYHWNNKVLVCRGAVFLAILLHIRYPKIFAVFMPVRFSSRCILELTITDHDCAL